MRVLLLELGGGTLDESLLSSWELLAAGGGVLEYNSGDFVAMSIVLLAVLGALPVTEVVGKPAYATILLGRPAEGTSPDLREDSTLLLLLGDVAGGSVTLSSEA